MLIGVVALDDDNGISKDGRIPWKCQEDMDRFKYLTMGKPVVISRTSWQKIKNPLIGRYLFVVSRDEIEIDINPIHGKNVVLRNGLTREDLNLLSEEYRKHCRDTYKSESTSDLVIAGGPKIYEATINYIDWLYVGRITGSYGCDNYFKLDSFKLVQTIEGRDSTLEIYARKRN